MTQYCQIKSLTLFKCLEGSHVESLIDHPCHFTRYQNYPKYATCYPFSSGFLSFQLSSPLCTFSWLLIFRYYQQINTHFYVLYDINNFNILFYYPPFYYSFVILLANNALFTLASFISVIFKNIVIKLDLCNIHIIFNQNKMNTSKLRSVSNRTKSNSFHQKNLLTRSQPLQIIPSEVVFKEIQVNQYYQITVEIRNLTTKATRIRILEPNNQNFKVLYNKQPEIAPGLSMTAKVKYQCKELKNETQSIKIMNEEGETMELPVRVYKTQSQILFQPFVNMGFLKLGKQHIETISIKNSGKANSVVQFSHSHGPTFIVQPKVLKIPASQQQKLIVKYKPSESGLFKGIINLKSDSILVKDTIDIHATAVQFARFIVDDKGAQTTSFDFGTLFVGQESGIRAFIVNNSPKRMKFKTFFRKGYLSSVEQFALVQTPTQIGNEQCERTMFIEPEIGEIDPFAEFEIKIISKSRVNYKDKIFTNNYALTPGDQQGAINAKKNAADFKPQNLHEYSIMVHVQEDDPMIMQLRANAVCPTIKVSQNIFKFGDCSHKQTREIEFYVENKSTQVKAEITFPKIPNFSIHPPAYNLKPSEKHTFKAVFEPKTIGKIDTTQLLLINKLYQIQMRCFGISTSNNSKSRVNDQLGSTKQIPSPNKTIDPVKTRGKAFSLTDKAFMSEMRKSVQEEEKMKAEFVNLTMNKDKFNQYLVDRRTERVESQKQQNVKKKWSLYQSKLKDLGLVSKLQDKIDDQGLPSNPPIDYEFQTGMIDTKLVKQNIPLPQAKEKLFVTRHILDYEPIVTSNQSTNKIIEKFFKDFKEAPKKIFPEAPQNYNHKREISQQLSPEELAQVQVSSNVIQFGEVYIKSISKGYFWVKNSSKKAISIQLKFKDQQLSQSNKKMQVIPSSGEAGFQIAFTRDTLGDFRSTIKYVINSVHQFEMAITAKCVPVSIQIDKANLKFAFDESSVEMSTRETIKLTNPGNSDAVFKFTLGKQRYFVPSIVEGRIGPKQSINVSILFTPPQIKTIKTQYNFTERLILKVLDGSEVPVLCTSLLHDPKFTVKPLASPNPILCVGHKFEDAIQVKNASKYPIVVHISGKLLQINEKIRINPDETKKFKVKFNSKEVGVFNGEINIQPRCGLLKTIQTQVTVIEPKLIFSKQELDFGVLVVQGIVGKKSFTLTNDTDIQMPLVFDLRPPSLKQNNPKGIQSLTLKLINSEEQLDVVSPTLKTESQKEKQIINGQNLVGMQVDEDDLDNSEDSEEQIVEKNQDELKRFKLQMKPKKQYQFQVQFYPRQISKYEFQIPMSIEGSKFEIKNQPVIVCEGIKPQFLFQPSIVDFKRKIITKPERSYPKYITITISNLVEGDCHWELHDEDLKKQGVFNIQKNKGFLKSNETIQVRASFNPYAVGQFEVKMPLFIKNKTLTQAVKYVDVVFKGTASLPNLFFNKREVIMPVVPLDIETTSSFKVLNDGYQNCNLKCQFLDDVADLGVKISFPEGNNIGITRQKLKIDLHWKYSKPISFCLKLQFTDDLNRTFVIPVSGTADNCIFTNYTYFLRNQNKYSIKAQGALKLTEVSDQNILVRKNSSHSLRSNVTGKSVMSYLGVSPISPAILSNTIDYINRYLNSNLLTSPIKQFPKSLIESDGQHIFQILTFVSNKSSNFPWKYAQVPNDKPINKVNKLFNQYNQLIKMLKVEGAQLNHIRPEYLLSFPDLNLYLGNLPEEKSKFYMPSLLKINTGLYNYLSLESWITLLYQIFKIYILARVTVKNFKSHLPSLPDIPKHYLQTSNFLSINQNLIFYWVEQAVLEVLLEERRLMNFDKDFRDGIAIAALLQKYSGVNVLKRMKMVCTSDEDFKDNAQVVCQGLAQIGMQNHITPKDIWNPLQRQMLLFILHLYVYLPFYIPKQEPVVFKCILGEEVLRSIELTNPSNKAVTYQVRYEGSEDFKIVSEQKFRIQPKQIFKFQVKFVSRISSPVKGKIMFINIKQNSLTAAALVFQLQSQIVGRTSDRIWNISGILYQQVQFTIDVFNKFTSAEMVDFAISYQTQYVFETRGKNKNQPPPPPLTKQQQLQTVYGKQQNIKIRKNGTATLTLNYIPMSLYTTKTTVFFLNNVIGQFQHEIIAGVEPPGTIAQVRPPMTLSVDQIVNWEYQINPKNDQINRAKKVIEGLKKGKKTNASKQKQKNQQTHAPNSQAEQFFIQIPPNPYINAKQTIQIWEKTRQDKKNNQDKQIIDSQNKIPFTIICKNPVYEFSTYILLFNKSKTDVRRYKVIFTVQPKPLKAILQMNVPARGEVTQNLPIVNNTQRDWNIKVQWQPDPSKNGNYFIVPSQYTSSFPVKKSSIGNFPITFRPKWANQAEAKLTLTNPLTLDHFQYQIFGHGEEPLAEEHIQIKCQAKQIIKKQLIIKNPYTERPVSFNIQTDLMNCTAPKKLSISSGGKQKFQFSVQPMLCGQYTGSITFFEQDGPQYLWYTISVITNYPQALKTLSINSEIRQKVLTEIHIPYEGKQQSTFQVIINGTGLGGDPTCNVKPNYDNIYILQFLPLAVGKQKGSICFINSSIGQILFDLELACTPKHPIIINNLKSPLGVSTSIYAELENPTQTRTTVKVTNNNPDQFVVKSHSIRLQPLQKKKIEIEYVPSTLDAVESAKIVFASKDIGQWNYELSGTGQMPVPYPIYSVFNGLFEEHSDSIKFRNPFKYEIVVGVKLIDESEKGIFKIMAHGKTRFQIDSNGVLEIPFSFVPTACKQYTCKVIVMISEKIFWTFPIRGVTQVNSGKIITNLISPCRQTATEFVQIPLEGVQYTQKNNLFEYSFQNIPQQFQKQIQKSLLVEFTKDNLKHAKDNLEIEFLFKPMKPIKVAFDLLITKKEGSRWRFRVLLEGTDPQVDDIIQIESNLMVTTTVSFKITNVDKVGAPFKSRFTSDSAHQFSVEPKQGTLAPFGSKGTNFFISFTPVQYGKQKKGKLIIETADMFWSYLLKGSLPKYVPPRLQGSRSRFKSEKK